MIQSNFPKHVKFLSTPRYLEGAVSVSGYDNFNLASHTGDNPESVAHNRALLVQHYNLPSKPKWLNQTHSDICLNASGNESVGDASITQESGVVCAILTADCLPIFACDKNATQVGVAHAGWQGIIAGVIESFIAQFNSDNLLVHFGPAISQPAFSMDQEVHQQFIAKDQALDKAFIQKTNKFQLDIYHAAKIILNGLGVESITGGTQCTFRQKDNYFSYRRDGEESGRMAHLIWMP